MTETKNEVSSTTAYVYDANNRLLTETKTTGDVQAITRYGYDNNGNQIYKGTESITPATSSTDTISAVVLGQGSDVGNVTINEYDGLNQLIKVTTGNTIAEYTYNGDGLRTNKKVNGVTTSHVWDGDQIALELDGNGNVTNKYVRGINLIYTENSAGTRSYYLFNGHGDVVQLTGTDGNVSKTYDYDAFGNEKNPDSADTNVFRYCGEYFDKETGTIYLRARYYDPEIGRFVTEDSNWGKDTDPLSLNLYTYCEDDPINSFDPTGHSSDPVDRFFRAINQVLWNIDTNVRNIWGWATSNFNKLSPSTQTKIVAPAKAIDDNIFWGSASGFSGVDDKKLLSIIKKDKVSNITYEGIAILSVFADGVKKKPSGKFIIDLPSLDATGKVHGQLPNPKDLSKYQREELEQLSKELKQSVKQRINKNIELGSDKGHSQRQATEQRLIKSIDRYLKGK